MSEPAFQKGDVVGRWFIKCVDGKSNGEWHYSITSMISRLSFGGIPEHELKSGPQVEDVRYSAAEIAEYLTKHNMWQ
jgi:hypothetical protein